MRVRREQPRKVENDDPLFAELVEWVERYVAVRPEAWDLRWDATHMPGDAVAEMLCSHAAGVWDLQQHEVERLWYIGRAMGWRPEELLTDYGREQALPGRGEWPEDPPGRWVRSITLGGGAHGPGRASPGRREFPAAWSEDEVIHWCADVARRPQGAVALPDGTFRAFGERQRVLVGVVVSAEGELLAGYPVSGPGVVQNPLSEAQRPDVERLEALLDALPQARTQEPRVSLHELAAVGEWPHVITSLFARDVPWTDEQRWDLAEVAEVAGLDYPDGFLD